jgi:hypothetical protein
MRAVEDRFDPFEKEFDLSPPWPRPWFSWANWRTTFSKIAGSNSCCPAEKAAGESGAAQTSRIFWQWLAWHSARMLVTTGLSIAKR